MIKTIPTPPRSWAPALTAPRDPAAGAPVPVLARQEPGGDLLGPSRWPAPSWQPFQVASQKMVGGGKPDGNRPATRPDGSRIDGRPSGDPRTGPRGLSLSPDAIKAAPLAKDNARPHVPDSRPEAMQNRKTDPEALKARIDKVKQSKADSALARLAVKFMEQTVKNSANKHKKKPVEGFKPPAPHQDVDTSSRGNDLKVNRQLAAPPKPLDNSPRPEGDPALKALQAATQKAESTLRELNDLVNKANDQKAGESPFLPSTGIRIPKD